MSDDEIILSELSDDDLVQQMHDDLYDGLKEEIEEGTAHPARPRLDPLRGADQGAGGGHAHRRRGLSRRHPVRAGGGCCRPMPLKAGMFILRPLLIATGAPKQGKMVIGTVKGDIHDIGKNLVGMMMEGGLASTVIDLGINNPVGELSRGHRGAPARHRRHVGSADHDHALHERSSSTR